MTSLLYTHTELPCRGKVVREFAVYVDYVEYTHTLSPSRSLPLSHTQTNANTHTA